MLARVLIAFKALRQLGLIQVVLNVLYKIGLMTGRYRRSEERGKRRLFPLSSLRFNSGQAFLFLFDLPSRDQLGEILGDEGRARLLAEANEIVAGKVRLFGAEPVDLKLTFDQQLQHWTGYETNPSLLSTFYIPHNDIKFLWEPARFGFAFILGRAYYISQDEKYSEAFWRYFESFTAANPPYLGPHWMSGQEVALRLMVFVWAGQIFSTSNHSTPERLSRLTEAVTFHASRIPPTLSYARSQNNNHLLTEAAGLYTAALALPSHPEAKRWRALGWKWLVWCFKKQIDSSGEYVQHSTNYQRLILQTALWVNALARRAGDRFPFLVTESFSLAAHWLYALLDPESGRVPNLGANDGAYIFPLASLSFEDYRPVVQAAARAFMNYTLPAGPWDEMALWFGLPRTDQQFETPRYFGDDLYAKNSWGYLRAVRYHSRPSHADQLHVDLWWHGLNIAQDAGTYLYNGEAPWDNQLTSTLVHNTVTVNDAEQMTRAGRFLYLDWVDATRNKRSGAETRDLHRIVARHDGYRKFRVQHERAVAVTDDERWVIEDELYALSRAPRTFRLHWLLPDWPWAVKNNGTNFEVRLESPQGWITLKLKSNALDGHVSRFSLARAGELVYGSGDVPTIRGWASPTYGVKIPALSLVLEVTASDTVTFASEFIFPVLN